MNQHLHLSRSGIHPAKFHLVTSPAFPQKIERFHDIRLLHLERGSVRDSRRTIRQHGINPKRLVFPFLNGHPHLFLIVHAEKMQLFRFHGILPRNDEIISLQRRPTG